MLIPIRYNALSSSNSNWDNEGRIQPLKDSLNLECIMWAINKGFLSGLYGVQSKINKTSHKFDKFDTF